MKFDSYIKLYQIKWVVSKISRIGTFWYILIQFDSYQIVSNPSHGSFQNWPKYNLINFDKIWYSFDTIKLYQNVPIRDIFDTACLIQFWYNLIVSKLYQISARECCIIRQMYTLTEAIHQKNHKFDCRHNYVSLFSVGLFYFCNLRQVKSLQTSVSVFKSRSHDGTEEGHSSFLPRVPPSHDALHADHTPHVAEIIEM